VTSDSNPAGQGAIGIAPKRRPGFLFGPIVDFLCLGGGSLLLFPILFLLPEVEYRAQTATLMLLVAHLVNHPHFAHSYQIFYRGYGEKAFKASLGRGMQVRYLLAGLVAPSVLVALLAYGVIAVDVQLLGYCANLMALTVGWHYTKQGYGMLMVDAALKRRYLDNRSKKVLLINSYVVWLAAWVSFNVAASKFDLWGLAYYSFDLPRPLLLVTNLAAVASSAAAVWVLVDEWRRKRTIPFNGAIAYGVSLYLWLMFVHVDPLWALVVPALHSLQYLVVVWRFQLNYETAQLASEAYRKGSLVKAIFGPKPGAQLAVFVVFGSMLGFMGFWGLPFLATMTVPYDQQALSGQLFLFVFWIFINVHHYFLDNVMWRRENPDTRKYLFG
jgi:hypothetical protein